ncbi:T-cell surface antigen CD2 [Leptodactylus fuscus]
MKSLLLLLLLVTTTTAIVQEVFVASGGQTVIPLNIRLDYTSGLLCNKYVWTFKGSGKYLKELARVNEHCNKEDCKNRTSPHCSLSRNGSLQLYGVMAQDAGQYTITTYHVNRAKNTEDTFTLHVLDAISQPVVKFNCLSDGQRVVSCQAAKGTNISASVIANGELLLDKVRSEEEENLYKVTPSAPWNISCSLTNKVSHETINVRHTVCPVPLSEPRLDMFCHPNGSVEIFCKIENGSDPSFSWSVDGNLVQSTSSWKVTENLMSGRTAIAVNVSCSVMNTINSVQSPVITVSCPGGTSHLTFQLLCKILLFFLYSALLISMVRDCH